MNFNIVHKFAKATQIALRLHDAGRPGLLDKHDFTQLLRLEAQGWKIYTNSVDETRVLSPQGDTIKIDSERSDIIVRGPQKEAL